MRRLFGLSLSFVIVSLVAFATTWAFVRPEPAHAQDGGKPPGATWQQKWDQFPHWMHRDKHEPEKGCENCHTTDKAPTGGGELRYVTLDNCATCHLDKPKKQEVVEFTRKDVEATIMMDDFDHFVHHDKNKLECILCHNYQAEPPIGNHGGKPRVRIYKDGFATPTIAQCRGCHIWEHEKHDVDKPIFQHPDEPCAECHVGQKIIEALPARARPKPDGEGRLGFSHIQHMGSIEVAKDAENALCARCHDEAATSERIDDGKVTALEQSTCFEGCHSLPAGKTFETAIASDTKKFTPPLPEFPHGKHVEKLGKNACTQCHLLNENDSYGWADGAQGLPNYAGCINCHETWKVDAHEKRKKTGPLKCRKCHTGNPDDRKELKTQKFEKKRLGPISYDESAHPFVCKDPSGASASTPAECAKCHRSESLPIKSRVRGKKFSHLLHFGKAFRDGKKLPSGETCIRCHTAIEGSTGPDNSLDIDLGENGGCKECHVGSNAETPSVEVVTVEIHPGFSHDSHLAHSDIEGCASCHEFDASGDTVKTKTDALECRKCHDHSKGRAEVTGPSELGNCNRCHIGESIFLAGKAPKAIDKAISTTIKAGLGKHHAEMTGACNKCHAANDGKGRVVKREGIESITHTKYKHPETPTGIKPEDIFEKFCNKCHISPKG